MAIFELVRDEFSSQCRSRGDAYFAGGRVKVLSQGPFLAQFRVRGSGATYSVNFDFQYGMQSMDVHCSCPFFEQGYFCKHIWSCLLTADAENIFPNARNLKQLDLRRSDEKFSDEVETVEPNQTPLHYTEPSWQVILEKSRSRQKDSTSSQRGNAKRAQFVIDLGATGTHGQLCVETFFQEPLKNGQWSTNRALILNRAFSDQLQDPKEREAFRVLLAANSVESYSYYYQSKRNLAVVEVKDAAFVLDKLEASGKLMLRRNGNLFPYRYDSSPWRLQLRLQQVDESYFLRGHFSNGSASRTFQDALVMFDDLILFPDFCISLKTTDHLEWQEVFSWRKEMEIQSDELGAFLDGFYASENMPPLDLPESVQLTTVADVQPQVKLEISTLSGSHSLLQFDLQFTYNQKTIRFDYPSEEIIDGRYRTKVLRNRAFEMAALKATQPFCAAELMQTREVKADGIVTNENFLPLVEKALGLGWEVIAHQKTVRMANEVSIQITSGVDWFDLNAKVNFDNIKLMLPQLLLNIKSGDRFVSLDDGTFGILPESWLAKFGPLAEIAKETNQGLRFSRVQALFVSSLLPENQNLNTDRKFSTLANLIRNLKHLKPSDPSRTFHGKLRRYQKLGLSWLRTLVDNDLGGILADDMGLGKTIQVLALLTVQAKKCPALIVAPKSLIFNWIKEAEKFSPDLKILNFTGTKRLNSLRDIRQYDVVLTTYQSLRMDIDLLKDVEFEHFILDEAQNIKNPKSQVAMACRLIHAQKKLALTGTPVENSLLDLFSILSVVLPGLVTDAQATRWVKENDPDTLRILSQALSPFILRRTKEQVLKDLPKKSEQVLYCELSPAEIRKYNELKAYFWGQLSGQLEVKGLSRSKIDILEALLRLRQAACHQGLLDKKLAKQSSAKFEMLLEQMESIIQDGHKALVFSQFTSLLALLQQELEQRKIAYEYLDGKTKDRESRVQSFQTNPDIKLFLLSLKAGGVGLNLTAADYVFILDPWWNPAAEAQAIDRCHRIGQNKKVLAYRLIAKNTVEEKILELQEKKRGLASTIISDEKSILKNLKLEDLRELFS